MYLVWQLCLLTKKKTDYNAHICVCDVRKPEPELWKKHFEGCISETVQHTASGTINN